MRGHKITDTMSDNQVLVGNITISPDANGTTTIKADDKKYSQNDTTLFEYAFPADKDCIGTYTITYKTKPATSDLFGTAVYCRRWYWICKRAAG